jgi:hypothetical protein
MFIKVFQGNELHISHKRDLKPATILAWINIFNEEVKSNHFLSLSTFRKLNKINFDDSSSRGPPSHLFT